MVKETVVVLFVDDEPRVLESITRGMFEVAEEWDIRAATSGRRALEMLAKDAYAIVVSDIRMPEMDGVTLLERVAESYPGVTRIVLSGQADTETIERAGRVAHLFLQKPCGADDLFDAVTRTRQHVIARSSSGARRSIDPRSARGASAQMGTARPSESTRIRSAASEEMAS